MALNTTLVSVQTLSNNVRNTSTQFGAAFLADYLDDTVVIAVNTLDQAVTLSVQISFDNGTTWNSIGNTASVPAGQSLVVNQYDTTLTGIRAIQGLLRVNAVCGVAPTIGTITIWMQGMSC